MKRYKILKWFIWIFTIFLVINLLYSQITQPIQTQPPNKAIDKSQNFPQQNNLNEDFLKEYARQLGSYIEKIGNTINVLAVFVSVFSILIPLIASFVVWRFERKTNIDYNYFRDQSKAITDQNKLIQQQTQDILKDIKDKFEKNFQEEIIDSVKKRFERYESDLKAQVKNFEQILLNKIEYEADPMEKRLMKAERLRSDIWDLLFPGLNNALEKQNWSDYLRGWSDFHKLQEALSQILSKNTDDICNGLGTFNNLYPAGIVPNSLWELVLLLKEQNRIADLKIIAMVEKLGHAMGRKLKEEPIMIK